LTILPQSPELVLPVATSRQTDKTLYPVYHYKVVTLKLKLVKVNSNYLTEFENTLSTN